MAGHSFYTRLFVPPPEFNPAEVKVKSIEDLEKEAEKILAERMTKGKIDLALSELNKQKLESKKEQLQLEKEIEKLKSEESGGETPTAKETSKKGDSMGEKRKFSVSEDGEIYPDEEGPYTFAQAKIISDSKKKDREKDKPKHYLVDEDGTIIKDEEEGEYTLSEAQVIASSRKKPKEGKNPITEAIEALGTYEEKRKPPPGVTPGELEAKLNLVRKEIDESRRDILDDIKDAFANLQPKSFLEQAVEVWNKIPEPIRNRILNSFTGTGEKIFVPLTDSEGKPQGGVPLDYFIEWRKFKEEQETKREQVSNLREMFKNAKELGEKVLEFYRELRGGKEGSEGLEGTDWEKESPKRKILEEIAKEERLVKVICPRCEKSMLTSGGFIVLKCRHCGAKVFNPEAESEVEGEWKDVTSSEQSEETTPESSEKQEAETPAQ